MGFATTTYDIKLQYTMAGNAGAGIDGLAAKAEGAMRGFDALKMSILGVAGVAGIGGALAKGKEVFIDFNNEMQQLQIGLGAVIQMNLGGTFEGAKAQASELFKEFQKFSTVTPLTTKQIAEFGQTISAAVFTGGGSMQDFINLTERGALAAKVLGVNADFAGVEMQHLLAGHLSSRMRFINQLMAPTLARHGMTREMFGQLDAGKRMSLIKEALNDPGLVNATRDFAKSFEGVTSTFKDKLQIALGKVGLPLFEKITAEIGRWNQWLEKNDAVVEKWGKTIAENLVTGFDYAKRAIETIVAHKDTLLLIGKMWTGGKILGAITGSGAFGSLMGGLGGLGGGSFIRGEMGEQIWQPAIKGANAAGGAMTGLASKIQGAAGVIGALGLLYVAAKGLADAFDEHHKKQIADLGDIAGIRAAGGRLVGAVENTSQFKAGAVGLGSAKTAFGELSDEMAQRTAIELIKGAKELGATKDKDFMKDQFVAALVAKGANKEEAKLIGEYTAEAFVRQSGQLVGLLGLKNFNVEEDKKGVVKKDRDINVRIDKIEVASDDPDKFAMGLAQTFERMVKNPVSAESALRGL